MDLIASHINIHGQHLGFKMEHEEVDISVSVSNMIIVDDLTLTSGSASNAQELLRFAGEMNIACAIRGNVGKTYVVKSSAAVDNEQSSIFTMSVLTNTGQIHVNKPIPPECLLRPHEEF